jgi:hypothetical protein
MAARDRYAREGAAALRLADVGKRVGELPVVAAVALVRPRAIASRASSTPSRVSGSRDRAALAAQSLILRRWTPDRSEDDRLSCDRDQSHSANAMP